MESVQSEIAAVAARLVVEEGLEYGAAKRRALKCLGLPLRTALPGNDLLEAQVLDYIAVFCAETQPAELRVLRLLALDWMQMLERFRPHLGGAVWHGSATRHTDIRLQLFCDDSKSAEIELIDRGVRYVPQSVTGLHGETVDALSVQVFCHDFQSYIGLHLLVYAYDDLRGAMRRDAQGRSPRGDLAAVHRLLHDGGP